VVAGVTCSLDDGVRATPTELTIFVDEKTGIIVTTYVDNLIFTGPLSKVTVVWEALAADVKLKKVTVLKDVGDACDFVGRPFTRVKNVYEAGHVHHQVD
jgi:hypothetical protein